MTHYETLGVSESASPEEITAAYRKIQKEYHPDVYKGDNVEFAQEKVKQANAAYDVLHDPTKKADYDRNLKYGASPFGQTTYSYGQQTNPYGQYGFGQQGSPFYTYKTTNQTGPNPFYYSRTQNQNNRHVKKIGTIGSLLIRLATFYLIMRLFGIFGFRLPFFFFFF